MYFELKENKPHGTKDDPFSTYHIENAGRSFQIPVHWHDEFDGKYIRRELYWKNRRSVCGVAGQSASYGITERYGGLLYLPISVKVYIFSYR